MKVNYCTETGIDFSIYFQQDFATIVVPHEGQMEPLLKSDLEEMSGAARIKGINAVFLETNYGLEIHSTEGVKSVGINSFSRLKCKYRIIKDGKYLNAGTDNPSWFHLHEARELVNDGQIVKHLRTMPFWEVF